MNIGDRIKLRRSQLEKTLQEVGSDVGVTRATIQRYENGNIQNIPSDKIELLAKSLKTTPAYLMGWEEDETINQSIQEQKLIESFNKLSSEGKEKVLNYTQDLVDSGKYAIRSLPTVEEMIDYLKEIPMAAFDGKLDIYKMPEDELYTLYKLIKDNE